MLLKKIYHYINNRKPVKYAFGILAGAGLGFLYYYFIGCNSGTCPITSNPYNTVMIGGLMGFIWVFSPGRSTKEE